MQHVGNPWNRSCTHCLCLHWLLADISAGLETGQPGMPFFLIGVGQPSVWRCLYQLHELSAVVAWLGVQPVPLLKAQHPSL